MSATDELRAAMRQWGWVKGDGSIKLALTPPSIDAERLLVISGSDFDRCCDAIDAVHAQSERENESLKAELDRVVGEQENRDGWIELPKDADGKPVRIGDVMEWPTTGETFEVVGIGDGVLFYVEDGEEQADWTGASTKRHHVSDTWERIIDDAEALAREWFNTDMSENEHAEGLNALAARCKALCERTKEDA